MSNSNPVAFLSYVRADDDHERGRITAFRQRLEGEVRMQTGRPFSIFQDNKDISWGQQWKERLDAELFNVTFLIPMITPSYFNSSHCRDEFEKFQVREKQLGMNTLILPIYYLDADQMHEETTEQSQMAAVLSQRNFADWRNLRFKALGSPEIDEQIAVMARTIKTSMREIQVEIAAAEAKPQTPPDPPRPPAAMAQFSVRAVDLSKFSPDVPTVRGRSGKKLLSPYYAYTQEFDEVISAETLIDNDGVKTLRAQMDRTDRRLKKTYADSISLAVDQIKALTLPVDVQVIFLVDNSGSFREDGRMEFIAGWLQIITQILEQRGVNSEILGFTTKAWKGGQSREQWLMDGKPVNPGRLNDLRHIIYKDFDQQVADCVANLGLMASGRLLKENIDGEALLWAFERTRTDAASHSIIVMITDGAPVDDSTLASNAGNFLESHLIATIEWLNRQFDVSLYGVGIDHQTNRYFPHGISAVSAKRFGLEVLEALPIWLETAGRPTE
ncbi:TIR domain-containing protein [Rhizobium leguminosarum]|uniref:cobaltochelatase CobT-related protein n=1 Tax=Rhizobium leguminosarum TaxID=384 RepID=UPI00103019CC|nr:TIR domain-containing protein [Rhizobium leguminosarum]TBD04815.1 TIR domain-containing protein [Rhizobium leguminosarum]